MIAIPNMSKPKGCRWCPLNHDSICYVIQPYKTDETNGEQCRNDCPLIEIDDTVWENEKYKLIRMTNEARFNKAMAERRADEGVFSRG